MDFWEIIVPLAQIGPQVEFGLRSFGTLFDSANPTHDPAVFSRPSSGNRNVEPELDDLINDLRWFHFANREPKRYLGDYPIVHRNRIENWSDVFVAFVKRL
jgi:hypothetical protein